MSALSRIVKLFARISGDEVSCKASSTVSTIPISYTPKWIENYITMNSHIVFASEHLPSWPSSSVH
jgi:hypothetical protein